MLLPSIVLLSVPVLAVALTVLRACHVVTCSWAWVILAWIMAALWLIAVAVYIIHKADDINID